MYNSLCSKLEITLTADALPSILAAITADDEKRLLRQLRTETATLVLMVRLENEKRKDEWKRREAEELETMRATVKRALNTESEDLWHE